MRGLAAALSLILLVSSSALALDGSYDPPMYNLAPELLAAARATSLSVAPDGAIIFGDITGPVKRVDSESKAVRTLYAAPAIVGAEWGLTGVAVAPDYNETGAIYVAYTTGPPGTNASRADVRGEMRIARVENGTETLVYSYVATRGHNGGKILIHDGLLYVANGDHKTFAEGAQDPSREEGKILRMTLDGKPAPGNPHETNPEWHPYAYSMGHRNPFGLAWDGKRGHLVASEAGNHSDEEVNVILPGRNYGWPFCEGRCKTPREDLTDAIVVYPKTITPVGMAVLGDDYYVASFNFGELRRVYETAEGWTDEVVYDHDVGLLDVLAHDGWVYFAAWNGVHRVKVPPREDPYVPPTPTTATPATSTPTATATPTAVTKATPGVTPTATTPTTPTTPTDGGGIDPEATIPGPGVPILAGLVVLAALATRRRLRG